MTERGVHGFPLPLVRDQLQPYIKDRREALKIRRILTILVDSHITNSKDDTCQSFPPIVPQCTLEPTKIPTELRGLRKEYTKAVQASNRAKSEYGRLTEQIAQDVNQRHRYEDNDMTASESLVGDPEPLCDYLALQKQRRRYEKLCIVKDYLERISHKKAAKSDYFDISILTRELPPSLLPSSTLSSNKKNLGADGIISKVDALIGRLEKNVLKAKYKLNQEQRFWSTLEVKNEADGKMLGNGMVADSRTTLQSLHLTRDELIRWIEGELAKGGPTSEPGSIAVPRKENLRSIPTSIEQYRRSIEATYAQYIKARKTLLFTVGMAISPLPPMSNESNFSNSFAGRNVEHQSRNIMTPSTSIIAVLSDHLLHTSDHQKSVVNHKAHLVKELMSQQRSTIQSLERLNDESHLLPAYPLLASQSKFESVAAALAPLSHAKPMTRFERHKIENGESLERARAWAFAADTASSTTNDAVECRTQSIEKNLNTTYDLLEELQALSGQKLNKQSSNGADNWTVDDEVCQDIWAPETGRIRKLHDEQRYKDRKRLLKAEGTSSTLWHDLKGTIGSIRNDS
ncbi:MAG: hypothetical protein M1827_004303 [Pycnora praestabilis]|nr:MAG: hypothetical protein M1827_004303 [Pycnora praestabilis]